MQKYEYTVQNIDSSNHAKATVKLNELGEMGWELVAVVPLQEYNGEQSFCYMKRPLN